MTYHERDGRRYLQTLAAIQVPAAALGFTAGIHLPHPIAVMTVVGCLTAIVAAIFIAPDHTKEPP